MGDSVPPAAGRRLVVVAWTAVWLLTIVMVVFAVVRVVSDSANLASGTLPPADDFARRYAQHPGLAYAHIVPGMLYLFGALVQLSARIRTRHGDWHRRLGRVVAPLGVAAGTTGLVVGVVMPWGGRAESLASALFGAWMAVALVVAVRAVRAGDVAAHRRWMVRAFAVGLAVATIRLWVGLFEATGLVGFRAGFGLAFWLAFTMHAAIAEWWLRLRPEPRVDPVAWTPTSLR